MADAKKKRSDEFAHFRDLLESVADLKRLFNLDLEDHLAKYYAAIENAAAEATFDHEQHDTAGFNFPEASTMLVRSTALWGSRVDSVHKDTMEFNMGLSKKKKHDVEEEAGEGEEAVHKKRRGRDGTDKFSFPHLVKAECSYFEPEYTRRNAAKFLQEAQFEAVRMKEPPTVHILPANLRPLPEHEKSRMCVIGTWAGRIEAIGKPEEFWTFAHTTYLNEEEWLDEKEIKAEHLHPPVAGTCLGCSEVDCEARGVKVYATSARDDTRSAKDSRDTLINKSLMLTDFVFIRKDLMATNWFCHRDLRPRSDYWKFHFDSVLAKQDRMRKLRFHAQAEVLNDTKFTEALSRCGPRPASTQLSSQMTTTQRISQGASQSASQGTSSQGSNIGQNTYPGRVSSHVEVAREAARTLRESKRFSLARLASTNPDPDYCFGDGGADSFGDGFDDDPDVPVAKENVDVRRSLRPRSAPLKDLNPWSLEALSAPREKLKLMDPYTQNAASRSMSIMAPQVLSDAKRCYNVRTERRKQTQKDLAMPFAERFRSLNWVLSAGSTTEPKRNEWVEDVSTNIWGVCRTLLKARDQPVKVVERRRLRSAPQHVPEKNPAEEAQENVTPPVKNPWDHEDDFAGQDWDDEDDAFPWPGGADPRPSEDPQPLGDKPAPVTRFTDLADEDMECDLLQEAALHNQGMEAASAYHDPKQRLTAYLEHALKPQDRTQRDREMQEWEDHIISKLDAEFERKEYDGPTYSHQALDRFESIGDTLELQDLCSGLEKYEIPRVFLASLIMANHGNVELGSDHAINSMHIKIVSRELQDEKITADGVL
ncbi:unnamed protein product, partial [Mesorhabditis spiculigera]